ncbi:MAG: glycosyltransferase, partial [bacterium]
LGKIMNNVYQLAICPICEEKVEAIVIMGLMLSRTDSQGVSACEMQATGLPVITSRIHAIPEFATGGTILINNNEVDKVEEIIDDINERGILEELSWKAHKGIVEKCGIEKVMREHLLLFHQLLKERRG